MRLKELGDRANAIEDYVGINTDAVLNKITQEFGEFNDAVQKYRGIYCKTKSENIEKVKEELGDVLLNIISLCNRIGIDPDKFPEFAENTLSKFEERKELYKKIMEENK